MTTYAAALAYRGLFGLLPFVFLVVVLVGLLRFDALFQMLIEEAHSSRPQETPDLLTPAIERGRQQAEPIERLVEQAREQASSSLVSLGAMAGLWSVYALARTLVEALNAAHEVQETRPGWKRHLVSLALGPFLAVVVILATGLMLIGPELIERLTDPLGLDRVFAALWAWLRFPAALLLLTIVLSVVYHFAPDVAGDYRLLSPGAVLVVVVWAVASFASSVYVAAFADYGATYGSLGVAIGLLVYLYLSASVVLLGAELNAALIRFADRMKGVRD